MDVPAEYYLDTIRRVFKERQLPRGVMQWRGLPVRPQAIRKTALLTVEGELDDISAPGQTLGAHRIAPNVPAARRRDHQEKADGHYGIINGRQWHQRNKATLHRFTPRP